MADDAGSMEETALATEGAAPAGRAGSSDLKEGDFLGRYRILSKLGAGGMGVVHRARDTDLNRDVAIKVLQPTNDGSQPADVLQQRLLREAQAMAQLSHPNLVTVYDVGKVGERVFVAMEFVDGMTLKDYLRDRTRTSEQRLAAVIDAARGLIEAHAAGVVHRDFKPENVFVSKSGRVQVGDFGLARSVVALERTQREEDTATTGPMGGALTQTGAIMGTPAYMSPEQHAGKIADARSDQFSLAVTAFEALYGVRPFSGGDTAQLMRATSAGQIVDVPKDSKVPRKVHAAIVRALRPEPEERFGSVETFVREIESAMPSASATRPVWLIPVAVVATAAVVAGAVVLLRGGRTNNTPSTDDKHGEIVNPTGRDYKTDAPAIVATFLDTQRLNFKGCYDLIWRKNPTATGQVELTLKIDATGQAKDIVAVHPEPGLLVPVTSCLSRHAKAYRFPAPRRNSATLIVPMRMSPPAGAGITLIGENHYRLPKATWARLGRRPQDLVAGGRIVPSVRHGKPNGFKIYAMQKGSIFHAIGLRNGDTMRKVNGYQLSTPQKLFEAYARLRTAKEIRLEISRRGKPMTLIYTVTDASGAQ